MLENDSDFGLRSFTVSLEATVRYRYILQTNGHSVIKTELVTGTNEIASERIITIGRSID